METNVNIERLVIEGIPLTHRQQVQVQAALREELARLLLDGGLSPELAGGAALPYLPVSAISLVPDQSPAALGSQIARALYSGLGTGAPAPGGDHNE